MFFCIRLWIYKSRNTMPKRKNKVAKSNFEHQLKQRRMEKKAEQLEIAVKYCTENGCRGSAAISANLCPDIKDARTINRRLEAKQRPNPLPQLKSTRSHYNKCSIFSPMISFSLISITAFGCQMFTRTLNQTEIV